LLLSSGRGRRVLGGGVGEAADRWVRTGNLWLQLEADCYSATSATAMQMTGDVRQSIPPRPSSPFGASGTGGADRDPGRIARAPPASRGPGGRGEQARTGRHALQIAAQKNADQRQLARLQAATPPSAAAGPVAGDCGPRPRRRRRRQLLTYDTSGRARSSFSSLCPHAALPGTCMYVRALQRGRRSATTGSTRRRRDLVGVSGWPNARSAVGIRRAARLPPQGVRSIDDGRPP
jgi:hypothetical protein